jgi:hypothetical protein
MGIAILEVGQIDILLACLGMELRKASKLMDGRFKIQMRVGSTHVGLW